MTHTNEEQYLIWLASLTSKEEILNEINAIIDYEQNSITLEKIINSLLEELTIINSLAKEASIEELKILEEDKNNITEKITIVKKELEKYEEKRKKEELLEQLGTTNVLFAKNKYGNFLIENDLKKIQNNSSPETYQSFINMIYQLINNQKNFNETKQKQTQSKSDKIKGVYELKIFQSRLLYRYTKNYIIIIGATIKKTDIDKKYREFCINKKEQSDNFVEKVEKNLINIEVCQKETMDFFNFLTEKGEKKLWTTK